MYSDPNLDTPPPRSQFRRPWSPEPFVPYHTEADDNGGREDHDYGFSNVNYDLYDMDHNHRQQDDNDHQEEGRPRARGTSPHRHRLHKPPHQQRREASDVSVEALDLADYARTLRFRQAEDPYPPFPSQLRNGYGNVDGNGGVGNDHGQVGSSMPVIPGLPGTRTRMSATATSPTRTQAHGQPRPPPNSLVSRGTLSSNGTHQTSSSSPSRGRQSSRRPFSIPVTPQASSSRGHLSSINNNGFGDPYSYPHSSSHTHSHQNRGPYIVDPEMDLRSLPAHEQELDISHFPKWSRGWYGTGTPSDHQAPVDLYDPVPPTSRLNTGSQQQKSPFDPMYVHNPYGTYDTSSSPPPPLSSLDHGSTRDLLPWSNDPPEYGPPLDPLQKEERVRMLEREFGANSKGKGKGKDDGTPFLVDEEGRALVGTVDERGRLVTKGPKRRVVVRILEVLLAVGACVPALYAAVAIKPLDPKKPPPPAGKPPVLVLYALSVITLLLLLYMFVIRPCCIVRRKPANHPSGMGMGMAGMGMMVLPVNNGKKGKKNKGGKKGKGKGGPGDGGDVQVNLIVDPDAFRLPGEDEDDSEDGSEDDESEFDFDSAFAAQGKGMPGGLPYQQKHKQKNKKRNRRRRRRGIREGLMMEEQWRLARSWAKKLALLDSVGVVLWGAAFVFIMLGKRCPSGEFQGWCNAYNVSTASGCLLCVMFGVSLFFDVQDLHGSKQSPRTRTK